MKQLNCLKKRNLDPVVDCGMLWLYDSVVPRQTMVS